MNEDPHPKHIPARSRMLPIWWGGTNSLYIFGRHSIFSLPPTLSHTNILLPFSLSHFLLLSLSLKHNPFSLFFSLSLSPSLSLSIHPSILGAVAASGWCAAGWVGLAWAVLHISAPHMSGIRTPFNRIPLSHRPRPSKAGSDSKEGVDQSPSGAVMTFVKEYKIKTKMSYVTSLMKKEQQKTE